MRTATKNKQKLYYALFQGMTDVPVIKNGVVQTMVIDGATVNVLSGERAETYAVPVAFSGNISTSGEADVSEFGISPTDYDALLVMSKGAIPITETSLIWHTTAPRYKDLQNLVVDPKSADYRVVAIRSTLNGFRAVLKHTGY